MSLSINELTQETFIDELVGVANYNWNILAQATIELKELITVSNGNIDVSTKNIGEIKAKSFLATTGGIQLQNGNLVITNGDLILNSGNISALSSQFNANEVKSNSLRNAGKHLKNFLSINTPGTIDVTSNNTILITSDGGTYDLSSSVVETDGTNTFSQEIAIFYVPTTGTNNLTLSNIGLLGNNVATMSPNSAITLRFIGSSWLIVSSNNVSIA